MCGIIGFTGRREAVPVLLDGLRRLEYRGYDSAGVATVANSTLHVRKRAGRVAELTHLLSLEPIPGSCGIGHTRWATHGRVTDINAHPHVGGNDLVAVVHNGVIENYRAIKGQLESEGIVCRTETDSEVIGHLIARHYRGDLLLAVQEAVSGLTGSYALAVVSPLHPNLVVGARLGSPLALGLGRDEHSLASDPSALAGCSDRIVHLEDRQTCAITPERWSIFNAKREQVTTSVHLIDWENTLAEKGEFDHFMLKEIHEQPEVLENALRGRLDHAEFAGLRIDARSLRRIGRVVMVACGTSCHAALIGQMLFEELALLPVDVFHASEFRYRNPCLDRTSLFLVITQSGETADTVAALREARRRGFHTLALTNVVGSTVAREADDVLFLQAGPEIGVASTKAFTAQLAVLTSLAIHFGRMRQQPSLQAARLVRDLHALPDQLRQVLACRPAVRRIAEKYCRASSVLYLGRKFLYPVALEGALKLKEISYIHAEGCPAGELKHGPIALIDPRTPSVFLAPRSPVYDKVMSNLEEVKARGGPIIAVGTEGDTQVSLSADEVVYVPDVSEYLQPFVTTIPLQLLAYEMALLRGCDIDKPRNLAKSVTVE